MRASERWRAVGRVVAAADVAAMHTQTQMDPMAADAQAVLATVA